MDIDELTTEQQIKLKNKLKNMIPLGYNSRIHTMYPIVDDPLDELLEPGTVIPERFDD
jgi:hypothetical protein